MALRVPCACSEEAPLQTGREDLRELDSLDTEKSLLDSPGGGCGPGGRVGGRPGGQRLPGPLALPHLWL